MINILRISAILLVIHFGLHAQNETDVLPANTAYFSDAPNSLYRYLADEAIGLLARRESDLSRLESLADWQKRQNQVRKILSEITGPFPGKTPLNARVVRTMEKEGFRIEHIWFESQPGFYVTSSLFIPGGLKRNQKAPAIIYCSGHTAEGYRSAAYMHVILNLVKKGFIVFAFDPVGQGERLEYPDPKTGKSRLGGPTKEHSYPGAQAFISGSSQARYMIWDGIRAVDYLFTRKEVDTSRIGITGRSGGGTQSACIAALDDRIYAAAPECYITNFTRLFQTIGPQDAEQNLFNGIIRGIDHGDLLSVRAPKPALMITTTRDMFSIQGAMETEREVSRMYKAYGKEDMFGRVEDDAGHESTLKNREALYAFFRIHLDNPGPSEDEDVPVLAATDLKVTDSGQVSVSLGSETIFSLNRKETEKVMAEWQAIRAEMPGHISRVLTSARKLSGFQEPLSVADPVFCGRIQREGYAMEKYYVRGEGNYIIPYLLMVPASSNNQALIILHPEGKSAVAGKGGEGEGYARMGFTVLIPDLVGTGETGPGSFKGDAFIDGTSHNVWYASLLIGRSIAGIRAGDVVRLVRLLKKEKPSLEIFGLARQEMSPVLLHAAAFEKGITGIALIGGFSSYRSIVEKREYISAFIPGTVPGALKEYDLPDLAACLAPRKLFMANMSDGNGQDMSSGEIAKEYEITQKAYDALNSGNHLKMESGVDDKSIVDLLTDWIR